VLCNEMAQGWFPLTGILPPDLIVPLKAESSSKNESGR
jgi:hypothetical protein